MIVFHPGDHVVIVDENLPDLNGNIATFVSYYPSITKDEELSELHAAIITASWVPKLGDNFGIMRLMPNKLVRVNIGTFPNNIAFHQDQVDKRVREEIEMILKNRLDAGVRVVDQMINRAVDKYLEELEKNSPEIKDEFFKRCQEAILQKGKLYEGDVTFAEHLKFKLQCVADEYIKGHREEIQDLMQDSIQHAASHLSEDALCQKMGSVMESWLKEKF